MLQPYIEHAPRGFTWAHESGLERPARPCREDAVHLASAHALANSSTLPSVLACHGSVSQLCACNKSLVFPTWLSLTFPEGTLKALELSPPTDMCQQSTACHSSNKNCTQTLRASDMHQHAEFEGVIHASLGRLMKHCWLRGEFTAVNLRSSFDAEMPK